MSRKFSGEEPGEGACLKCCRVSEDDGQGRNAAQSYSLPADAVGPLSFPPNKGFEFFICTTEKNHGKYSVVYNRVSKLQPKSGPLTIL